MGVISWCWHKRRRHGEQTSKVQGKEKQLMFAGSYYSMPNTSLCHQFDDKDPTWAQIRITVKPGVFWVFPTTTENLHAYPGWAVMEPAIFAVSLFQMSHCRLLTRALALACRLFLQPGIWCSSLCYQYLPLFSISGLSTSILSLIKRIALFLCHMPGKSWAGFSDKTSHPAHCQRRGQRPR